MVWGNVTWLSMMKKGMIFPGQGRLTVCHLTSNLSLFRKRSKVSWSIFVWKKDMFQTPKAGILTSPGFLNLLSSKQKQEIDWWNPVALLPHLAKVKGGTAVAEDVKKTLEGPAVAVGQMKIVISIDANKPVCDVSLPTPPVSGYVSQGGPNFFWRGIFLPGQGGKWRFGDFEGGLKGRNWAIYSWMSWKWWFKRRTSQKRTIYRFRNKEWIGKERHKHQVCKNQEVMGGECQQLNYMFNIGGHRDFCRCLQGFGLMISGPLSDRLVCLQLRWVI